MKKAARSFVTVAMAALLSQAFAHAINIRMDYRYDTAGFFSTMTTNGQAARATVDAAATFFSTILDDTLAAIPFQDPNTPGGQNTPVWRQVIRHPGTGQQNYSISSAASEAQDGLGAANEYRDIQILSNELVIYAGATSLANAGEGGGGFNSFGSASFNDLIAKRGKPAAEFSTWGGYVTFDNDGGVDWHLSHTTAVPNGKLDLYSTALHEIGHVLGLNGGAAEWTALQVGAEFRGPNALAAWKADDPSAPVGATGVPTVSSGNRHWRDNLGAPTFAPTVRSKVIGTNTLQETAMDPVIFTGGRKLFTNLDGKALVDIGWTVPNSVFTVTPNYLPADFNEDTFVNDGDLTVWRGAFGNTALGDADGDGDSDANDFLIWQRQVGSSPATVVSSAVPEPSTFLLAGCAALMLKSLRRRR